MAEKQLKGINFPGLDGTYEIPQVDDTLQTSGAAADAKATGEALSKKANTETIDAALAKKAEYVLLWANASKTSSFAAQTIADKDKFDASGYSYLMIVCSYGKDTKNGTTATFARLRPKGDGDTEVGLAVHFVSESLGLVVPFRKLTIASNRKSATFGAGHKGDGTEDNNYCIPYYIYGVKGIND